MSVDVCYNIGVVDVDLVFECDQVWFCEYEIGMIIGEEGIVFVNVGFYCFEVLYDLLSVGQEVQDIMIMVIVMLQFFDVEEELLLLIVRGFVLVVVFRYVMFEECLFGIDDYG